MLWDPESVKKDGEEKEPDEVPVTPILVPLQQNPKNAEKGVPVLIPDVKDLKDQFQQQQNMLTQIKETLKENESKLSSKEKQVEVYANKLSQIRARTRNSHGKKSDVTPNTSLSSQELLKKSSKENLSKIKPSEDKSSDYSSKSGRKGKVSELKKCLEENKIKFEQRTGKEQSETKKIESLVEQLKMQLEERDKTIQELQRSIEQPKPKIEPSFHKKIKQKSEKESVASKTTQTTRIQNPEDSTEDIEFKKKIYDLEAHILDLEENLKEKESVIEARTQAVTLLSQDLSIKGKNTLDSLEETRQEMRTMQNNFIAIEDQLKKDLAEKENRYINLEEKCKKLESTNFELSVKNAEMQEKYFESAKEIKFLKELTNQGQIDATVEELTKKINILSKELDDRNKLMIKIKIEHKNKIKNLNHVVETLKGTSDDKKEIVRLNSLLEEFENIKIKLENRVAELEDEKATEKKLKDQMNELEIIIQKQNEDLTFHLKTISNLEKENLNLIQLSNSQKLVIEELNKKIQTIGIGTQEEIKFQELCKKIEKMEEDHIKKVEDLRTEHSKEIEMLESYYNAKVGNIDRKELEEYRISAEMNNIHVEEQIELLIREKQQLLEKLKSLSGISSTDSLNFEKMEHSDLKDDKEIAVQPEEIVAGENESRISHLQRIVNDQQILITDLQKSLHEKEQKSSNAKVRITELEEALKKLEEVNTFLNQPIRTEPTEFENTQKSNLNTKNRIKKIQIELNQNQKIIQEQNEKLSELNLKLQEKEELIKKYTEKIELFEKDDWDRQNHWKNSEDGIESFQELQKKCLSLENSLIELSEDCERLRKENIEVVHLLSEEKVKRKKLQEQLQSKHDSGIENKIDFLSITLRDLEEKVEKLELNSYILKNDELEEANQSNLIEAEDFRGKIEWANVVLTGKETEIFRLQNLLEDQNKSLEILQGDLSDYKIKLEEKDHKIVELIEELETKETQLKEISVNFDKLQECVNVANQKTAVNESQLKNLLATVKVMEEDVFRKESELQEIKGILGEKNLDMTNLRNRLEEVNSDLTYSYQEHLENMGKCLRDKESEYDALLVEKNHLEEIHNALVAEKQDIYNKKVEVIKEKENLQISLAEKELVIRELNEKLVLIQNSSGKNENKNQEIEEMKVKMKKLAANLKKKAQIESDLLKQIKDLESSISEKIRSIKDVKEKLETEKDENLKIQKHLSDVLAAKATLENERACMKEKLENSEKELHYLKEVHENKEKETNTEIQNLKESLNETLNYKGEIEQLKEKIVELSGLHAVVKKNQNEMEEERKSKEISLEKLAEMVKKYEKVKVDLDHVILEKCDLEKRVKEMEELATSKTSLDAKIQENLAVIESLEGELTKTRDQLKNVEEKLFHSEERRLSLENKNQEMCRKMMEDSETLYTIEDLSAKVDELLKSEKSLQDSVNALESGNSELKQTLDKVLSEKILLEGELKLSSDKVTEISNELKQSKDADGEKSNLIRDLSKEVERLKSENLQILLEFQKLNKDYEQFETDFKENLENSQAVEKLLKHKIEELTNENSNLSEKYIALAEEKDHTKTEDKRKKRKSVTFRTDEVEYIKQLKSQLHNYDSTLKEANQEIEALKADLFREKLRGEVTKVIEEAQEKVENLKCAEEKLEKSTISESLNSPSSFLTEQARTQELKFDANMFFKTQTKSFLGKSPTKCEDVQGVESDSLMWDDGWGTDGYLEEEYLTEKTLEGESTKNPKIESLEIEVAKLQKETQRLSEELQDQTTKYAKAIKKLKEMKVAKEKTESELNKLKSSSSLGDLDAAIVEELKLQIESLEGREKELLKSLEISKNEKESLMKKIDVLNAGNEKFLEMKEKQDNETELWQKQNNELLNEISELRQQLQDFTVPDENHLIQENRELKNKIEALEWKNCELNELLEEKQELLDDRSVIPSSEVKKAIEEKSLLQKEIDELNNVKKALEQKLIDEERLSSKKISELNKQLTILISEKKTLEDVLREMKKSDAAKDENSDSKIFDYFKSSPDTDAFLVQEKIPDNDSELELLRKKNLELEELLRVRSEEKNKSFQDKIFQLETVVQTQQEKLKITLEKEKEMELNKQKIIELENMSRSKEEEILLTFNQEKEELKRKFLHLESEKVNEIARLTQKIFELEFLLREKDEEIFKMKEEFSQGKAVGIFEKDNANRLPELLEKSPFRFESIDLTQEPEAPEKLEDVGTLREKVLELEGLIVLKEDELLKCRRDKEKEAENFRQRIFQLENLMEIKERELSELEKFKWDLRNKNEAENLQKKIKDLEDFVRFKENEICQIQTIKANQIQSLEQKIYDLENLVKNQNYGAEMQHQFLELQNLLKLKENECDCILSEKSKAKTEFELKIQELQNLVSAKEEEINRLINKLNELDKSYNDSKLEIERLLNEEKLNTEEKFVEPFQKNIEIPVAFEVEALSRTLNEEKQKSECLLYDLKEKENLLYAKNKEIQELHTKLFEIKAKEEKNVQLEQIISDLEKELENSNLQLNVVKRELEEFQNVKDETLSNLKIQLRDSKKELLEFKEKTEEEMTKLKKDVSEKTKLYESVLEEKEIEENEAKLKIRELERIKRNLEKEVEILKSVLQSKEGDITTLALDLEQKQSEISNLKDQLEARQTLNPSEAQMIQIRNFQKLGGEAPKSSKRTMEENKGNPEIPVNQEGHPDLSDWTEHELDELNTRLQSDLDTALYMLHQRDVRCDELTFELMQLLEERDTLQLRLSTALRINEELRALCKMENPISFVSLEESKDLEDQSNDRQIRKNDGPREDLRQLANKISELHSVSYLRDKTVKDDSVQRHMEQMNLLSRISDSDLSLARDVQSSSSISANWVRGKSTPKIMHV